MTRSKRMQDFVDAHPGLLELVEMIEAIEAEDSDKLDPDSITCPDCNMTSYNPNDIREGYCGNCHDWTGNAKHG